MSINTDRAQLSKLTQSRAPTTRTLGKDDWMTPAAIFDPVQSMCQFDLDACATDATAARVAQFIGPETDALSVRWADHGKRVWCNPPYGRGIDRWLEKASKACLDGCDLVVVMINANTDTKYWRAWVADNPNCFAVVFIQPRVKFDRPDGEKSHHAPKGSALVFLTPAKREGRAPVHRYWNYVTESFSYAMQDFIHE